MLELGCGRAEKTRTLAESGRPKAIIALEVDTIQHARNLEITDLPQVSFRQGGAEAIPADDASADIVIMFKSLHHVPVEHMDQALKEIAVRAPFGATAAASAAIPSPPRSDRKSVV